MVSRLVVIAFCAFASRVHAGTTHFDIDAALDRWQPLIAEAAHRFAIPAAWIGDVMRAESAGQAFIDDQPTTSTAGAMGLMQVMPATYAELRERYGLGADPYDPHDNIFAGAAYLHELYERYGWPSLFAAYHAGTARFEQHLSTGRALPAATLDYVAAVVPEVETNGIPVDSVAQAASIFVSLNRTGRATEASLPPQFDDGLFVRLKHLGADAQASGRNNGRASPERSDAELQ
jgi:hypothetical protein